MAQPDRPNFSLAGHIIFGLIALGVIYLLLHFLGYIPGK